MSKKIWIAILAGVAAAVLVTGGLVIASGGGGRPAEGVCIEGSGCACECGGECTGECNGDCSTCGDQECARNQAGETDPGSASATYDGNNPAYRNQQGTTGQGLDSGIVNNGGGYCDGSCGGACGSCSHGGCNGTGSCDGNCVDHGGRRPPGRNVR